MKYISYIDYHDYRTPNMLRYDTYHDMLLIPCVNGSGFMNDLNI